MTRSRTNTRTDSTTYVPSATDSQSETLTETKSQILTETLYELSTKGSTQMLIEVNSETLSQSPVMSDTLTVSPTVRISVSLAISYIPTHIEIEDETETELYASTSSGTSDESVIYSITCSLIISNTIVMSLSINNSYISQTFILSELDSTQKYIPFQSMFYEHVIVPQSSYLAYYSDFFVFVGDDSSSLQPGAVVGIVVGLLAFVLIVAGVAVIIHLKNKERESSEESMSQSLGKEGYAERDINGNIEEDQMI